jgi:CHASE2 domain-containing sensor protein
MKNNSHIFNLKIQKIEQICLFELSWGEGQRLSTQVSYPSNLNQIYQDWRQAYLNFYQSDNMRGRIVDGGIAVINIDWHAELVKAESKLMYEFNRWLRSGELYEIRAQIARGSEESTNDNLIVNQPVQIFLTCAPIELDRFPWEAWEIGTEFGSTRKIRIIRAPLNINAESTALKAKNNTRRTRVLAILGDDKGLNFEVEKKALKDLEKILYVEYVGWQPQETPSQVTEKIINAIADEKGWDLLFFAGHSNETDITGGELGIAPGVSISIQEITTQLSAAKKRGLKVAIFNSCSGLNIADSLIDLGFSQVVVMREPIHNSVAQEFLVRLLQSLGKHLDLYESLTEARQFLRNEKSHTYPSAYLVPSLFCHPGAKLFRIPVIGWKQYFQQTLPNYTEAVVITATLLLSLLSPIQEILQDGRLFAQAAYRNITAQIPNEEAPPVALVQIDTDSIARRKLPSSQLLPISRIYLGELMEQVRKLNASVVTLDIIVDTPQKDPPTGDKALGTAVKRAVDQNAWIIFTTNLNETGNQELEINQANGIRDRNWTVQGYSDANPYFLELPNQGCRQTCPISYLMALVYTAKQEITDLPQPKTSGKVDLRTQLLDAIAQKRSQKDKLQKLTQWQPSLGLQPIVDYSIPPKQVYTKIPAWKLLENPDINQFPLISKQVVLIAVGSDERLGMTAGKPDYLPTPSATSYWTQQRSLTGGEVLAYMTHHFLTQRLVIPIPDFWMVGIALILGKITAILLVKKSPLNPKIRLKILISAFSFVMLYLLFTLQIYISAAILLPWLLPSSAFLAYIIPSTMSKKYV